MSALPPALFKRWIHSYEEDAEGVSAYRPSDYRLPPARGRRGFEIRAGGEFIAYEIAPTDGWLPLKGRWKAQGPDQIRVRFEERRRAPLTLHILSCEEDLLRITGW